MKDKDSGLHCANSDRRSVRVQGRFCKWVMSYLAFKKNKLVSKLHHNPGLLVAPHFFLS